LRLNLILKSGIEEKKAPFACIEGGDYGYGIGYEHRQGQGETGKAKGVSLIWTPRIEKSRSWKKPHSNLASGMTTRMPSTF
jgi:hypothetical protein